MTTQNEMHWNLGGWLGGQLGGTLWILIAGLIASTMRFATGLVVVGLFVAPNIFGFWLWSNRDRIAAYRATQILLPIEGAFGLAAVFVLDRAGLWEAIQQGGSVSAETTYVLIVIIVIALMLLFRHRFGGASESDQI